MTSIIPRDYKCQLILRATIIWRICISNRKRARVEDKANWKKKHGNRTLIRVDTTSRYWAYAGITLLLSVYRFLCTSIIVLNVTACYLIIQVVFHWLRSYACNYRQEVYGECWSVSKSILIKHETNHKPFITSRASESSIYATIRESRNASHLLKYFRRRHLFDYIQHSPERKSRGCPDTQKHIRINLWQAHSAHDSRLHAITCQCPAWLLLFCIELEFLKYPWQSITISGNNNQHIFSSKRVCNNTAKAPAYILLKLLVCIALGVIRGAEVISHVLYCCNWEILTLLNLMFI